MTLLDCPSLGIGTWFVGDNPATRDDEISAIRLGLDAGLRIVDTAEMYGDGRAEDLVGEAIAGRRDEVFLVSKVLPHHASYEGVGRALRASLTRLGTDYLDLYLLHWRGPYPLSETIRAFDDAIADGLIGAWGVSNFDPDDLAELGSLAANCETNQVLYNLTRRGPELDLFPQLRSLGMPTMAYSPIEQGRLFAGANGRKLAAIADRAGYSPAALALAWVMRDGQTVAIPKAGMVEHMADNLAALDVKLTSEILAELDAAFPAPASPIPLETL